MIILKEGSSDLSVQAKSRVSEPLLEETVDPIPSEELSLDISEEADVIFDRLEYTLVAQVNDLADITDFNEKLKSFHANLVIQVGVLEFFRLESYKKDVKHIVQILEESEENESLNSEKLSELIVDLKKIVGSVSFKRELAELR